MGSSSQLANYWRRYFQIPEISPYGNWHPHHDEAPGSPDSVHESGMDDTDSIIANVDINPPPVQIHQLATFLWNILNNDREANMAILERLEDTEGDLSRHPVQIFSAAIWLTLPVTWRNLQGLCQTKHVAWRHYLTKACEL